MKNKIMGIIIMMLLIASFLSLDINAKDGYFIKEKTELIVFSEPDIQEGNKYLTLNVKEATSCLMEPGNPVLPVYVKTFKFSYGTKIKRVECKPLQVDQKVISGEIYPSPEPVPLENANNAVENKVVEDFVVKDNAVYDSIDFIPSNWYDYRIGCGLDGSTRVIFLNIRFYPIRYSPGQNMIKYANSVEIKVEYFEPPKPVNFPDKYDMVIITPLEFSEDLQPLVDYKNDGIIVTKLVTLEDIYSGTYFPVMGRDDQEKIKYFIKDAIENWDITYIMLAGGANKIPIRMSYVPDGEEDSFISDLYYADIYNQYGQFCNWDANGNDIFGEYTIQGNIDLVDLYPDVHLGRLNFRSIDKISNVVDKIITYESTGAYMEDWFSNFVVCGGDTFEDDWEFDEGEALNQDAIDMMTGFIPEKIWATNGKLESATNIDNAIEDGAGFIYFSGHGTNQNWATHPHNDFGKWIPFPGGYRYSRVEELANGEMLPIVFIGGCSNAKFSGSISFVWSFIKSPNGGGISSYGYNALGWGYIGIYYDQGLVGGMELSFFKGFTADYAENAGELYSNALNNYISDYGLNFELDFKTVEELEPFCDPSLRIVKISDRPNKPNTPDGPTSGIVKSEYTYSTSTTDPDGNMIKYCFDWGDGTVSWTDWLESGELVSLSHIWETPGYFDIKVKVRDEYGLDSVWSEPLTMHIEGAIIDIQNLLGGFLQVSAVIKNIGDIGVIGINWSISVKGGIFGWIIVLTDGIIDNPLEIDNQVTVTSKNIFGLGKVDIIVTASAPTSNIAMKTASGFVFGPFIFLL